MTKFTAKTAESEIENVAESENSNAKLIACTDDYAVDVDAATVEIENELNNRLAKKKPYRLGGRDFSKCDTAGNFQGAEENEKVSAARRNRTCGEYFQQSQNYVGGVRSDDNDRMESWEHYVGLNSWQRDSDFNVDYFYKDDAEYATMLTIRGWAIEWIYNDLCKCLGKYNVKVSEFA